MLPLEQAGKGSDVTPTKASSSDASCLTALVTPFPSVDLVPRKETNALQFVQEHPEWNGCNVLIGILDTGIDPGATGLRYMGDGVTPKLIDLVDCTGSGDVDISTKRQTTMVAPQPDAAITANYYFVETLSGNMVQMNKSWWKETHLKDGLPPTVQLGLKLAYELFPASVTARVKAHRQRILEQELHRYIAVARSKLSEWQHQFVNIKPSVEELRVRDDLQARMEVLTDREWESENDPGMVLDCIVFFDGRDRRAVIGCVQDEGTDWTNKVPLAAFRKERQYSTVSTVDQYNYGVNFYDNAKVLSIVGDCTPHGTHVAAIAAAAEGDRSGVAPGAQLISIKIGDSRMGSMESGSSIARGIMTAIRSGCDVINLSYGEGSQIPNAGRVIRMAEELVWRHNIVFVSAVGNNGPALSTVNAPGGVSSCILGVAAYVSPVMMKAEYSLESNTDERDALVGTTYTWSSVGPTTDGDNGVSVCAPGGAITSVSNWTMQKSMLMNGTSMASPHACGCVALLLSACKANIIPISPPRIQRALENSAELMPNLSSLQQGYGMVQVDKALEYLIATKDIAAQDIHFQVFLEGRAGNPRGIYLRQPQEATRKQAFSVRVNPKFRRTDKADDHSQKTQIDFEMKFTLKSTASWVSVPEYFMLMNNGRAFKISLDPSGLPYGVHKARVSASDADHPESGVLWSIPITIIKPMEEQQRIDMKALEFAPAQIKRFFVSPPPGATWMDVIVRDGRDASNGTTLRLYVLHTIQLIPHAAYRDYAEHKYLNLLPAQTSVTSISVEGGITCEVDIGRYWSASGSTIADVTIEFRGIQPIPPAIIMNSGDSFALVRLHSELKDELISPAAKLTKWKTPLRPKSEGAITPLGERDIQPWSEKKTYQLVLTYEFSQDEKGTFTPRAPPLQEVLYESAYESQMILVYDGDKKYLGFCDAFSRSISVPKGTIVMKLQVRHDDPTKLEKLNDMTIWIERKLDKEISLTAYSTREDLLIGGKRAMKKRTLRKGTCTSAFFSEPPTSKFPSSCNTGDVLMGSCTFVNGEGSLPGDGKRPNGFPVTYVVGPKMVKGAPDVEVIEAKEERSAEERLSDAIRDLKVSHLDKLTKEEKESGQFEKIYSRLIQEYPDHVPLLMASLKHLDGLKKRKEILPDIIKAADEVVAEISEDELALHFGKKQDKDDPEKAKRIKEMEKMKSNLIEALVRKTLAYADSKAEDSPAKFEETLGSLKSWAEIDTNGKYAALALERDHRLGRHGLALKRINKLLLKNGKDTGGVKPMTKPDLLEKRALIFKEIGYEVLYNREQAVKLVSAPADYKLF